MLTAEHRRYPVFRSRIATHTRQTLQFNGSTWRVPYDSVVTKNPKQVHVSYCLQFLLILILYPIPDDGHDPPPKNYFRHFLGRLHRPQDFDFLVEGMLRALNQPVSAYRHMYNDGLSNVGSSFKRPRRIYRAPRGQSHGRQNC